MKNLIARFRKDDEGAALIEYAVILGIVLALTAATLTSIGGEVNTIFGSTNNFLQVINGG